MMILATFQSSFHILIHSTLLANFFINCRGFTFVPTKIRATTGRISVGASLAFSTPNTRLSDGVSPLIEGKLKSVSNAVNSEGSSKLSLLSPCKINLFLRIERRRPDGYHDLASLFQAIGLGDTLNMELLPSNDNDDADDIFTCNMEGIPTDQSNLVLRALNLMRKQTGYTQKRFKIDLIKRVPAQAGLGGGSANAATAMFGVNELLNRPATYEQLVEWSASLGSDVTFFFSLGTAYCTGRGEIIKNIDPPFPRGTKVFVVKPKDIGLSTPKVFEALEYDKLSSLDPLKMLQKFCDEGGVVAVEDEYHVNDLENPAYKLLPQLQDLRNELKNVEGFTHVCMSGSGTSIFCIGIPKDMIEFENKFVRRPSLHVFSTEFISRPNNWTWWN